MRKVLGLAVLFVFIMTIAACGSHQDMIFLEAKNIQDVEIVEKGSQKHIVMADEDDILKLVAAFHEHGKGAYKESVNDQPIGCDDFVTITFHPKSSEEEESLLYLYEKEGKTYMEEPYVGIWEVEEDVYQEIRKGLMVS